MGLTSYTNGVSLTRTVESRQIDVESVLSMGVTDSFGLQIRSLKICVLQELLQSAGVVAIGLLSRNYWFRLR